MWVLTWENVFMPYNFAGGGDGGQLFLLPPDPREWLPPGHLAWAVLEQAGRMDLAPFVAWYRADGQGKKAYHPQLMVALVMYCYCKGIRSSRAVEMATFDDVGARVICGNLHPDHATVARFVSRHEQAVKGLLVSSLVACARQGLVSVDVVAGVPRVRVRRGHGRAVDVRRGGDGSGLAWYARAGGVRGWWRCGVAAARECAR